jgi:hypothetical protein
MQADQVGTRGQMTEPAAGRPPAPRIAAVTHVRNDDFFLNLWAKHYGRMIGRENCFVILDGDDWTPWADLSGVHVTVLPRPRAQMNRVRIDRRMQNEQLGLIARIFEELKYDYVIKGDCDEYVVPDPLQSLTIADAVREADLVGAVYSSGINVLHDTVREPGLNPLQDVMSQRHLAVLSQGYCKVNLVSRPGYEQGIRTNAGGHRVAGALPVHASQTFYMLHLGWCDVPMWQERNQHRIAFDRDGSFQTYADTVAKLFASVSESADRAGPLDPAMAAARTELCFTDGVRVSNANKFRRGNFACEGNTDYLVRLDQRFHGCIG